VLQTLAAYLLEQGLAKTQVDIADRSPPTMAL
jgi:hypothetical protein